MSDKQTYCLLAEFKGPNELLSAASKIKDEGYIDFDCFTPFPVHGLDDAMGLKRSVVGYIVAIGCILGASGGLLLQWWSSAIEYPVVISGKPFFSWQAFMIITVLSDFWGILGLTIAPDVQAIPVLYPVKGHQELIH